MATTELTVNAPNRAAQTNIMEPAAEGDGNVFTNKGRELLLVANGDIDPVTLTFATTAQIDGEDADDKEIIVPANSSVILGPFPVGWYNNGDGQVTVTFSSVADVEVAVIQP